MRTRKSDMKDKLIFKQRNKSFYWVGGGGGGKVTGEGGGGGREGMDVLNLSATCIIVSP